MKKLVHPYVPTLILLMGFLTSLGILSYWVADYPQTLAHTIQHHLPSDESILRWLITI